MNHKKLRYPVNDRVKVSHLRCQPAASCSRCLVNYTSNLRREVGYL